MIEVVLQYKTLSGVINTETIGLAETMREVRELVWGDAEKFHGKDVVLNREDDKYAVYINGTKDTTEWYLLRKV